MKMRSYLAGCTLILALLLCLCSCGDEKEKFTAHSFEYFDTVTSITGYEADRADFDEVTAEIFTVLSEYHRLFDIYKRYDGLENLCSINELQNGVHRVVKVDNKIIDMLLYSVEMYEKTGGEVNVAMGSVLRIWHEYRTDGMDDPASATLPPMERLKEASEHTDIRNVVIDKEAGTVFLSDPKMSLDVGAIAKGYAVEMVAQMLLEKGVSGYVINVGGNVRTVGTRADGSQWKVGVENPLLGEDDPYLAYLDISDMSLVTSGSYQRYYTVDGKSYHHIIDKDTLMPSEGYISVAVLCESSAMGDAFSTALFCMTPEEGRALAEATEGLEVMWVTEDGEKIYTDGFLDFAPKEN